MKERIFTVRMPGGNSQTALEGYFTLRDWILDSGMLFVRDLRGILNHPAHPESPVGVREVPMELVSKLGWETTTDIVCETDEAAAWVRGLALPAGAKLEEEDGV